MTLFISARTARTLIAGSFILMIAGVANAEPQAPKTKVTSATVKVYSSFFTGFEVKPGDKITIGAGGVITLGPLAGKSGPNGISYGTSYNIVKNASHGELVGKIGSQWYIFGSSGSFKATSSGVLELYVNDNDAWNNSGFYTVTVSVNSKAPAKNHMGRVAELDDLRKHGNLDDMAKWFKENPNWTDGLPTPPPTISEAERLNAEAEAKGLPKPWHIGDASKTYHQGDKEVRQAFDVPGQKFPGASTQGVYKKEGDDYVLIPNEGTPDIASPRGFPNTSDLETWRQHMRTDVAMYDAYMRMYGPIKGEKLYRDFYNAPLPDSRYKTPEILKRQKEWEQKRTA